MYLRQSTSQIIRFGPCLDITDGVTEETALTLAQADMRLSKDGGAFAQKSAAGNATHDSDGWYSTTLSTTDTNTVGELILNVHQPANMLPVWKTYWVLEESVYDAIFGASATLNVNAATIASSAISTATFAAGAVNAAALGADCITAAKIADNAFVAANFAASSLDGKGDWNVGKTGYSLTATTGLGNQTANITGNLTGSVGSVTGAVGSVTSGVTLAAGAVTDASLAGNMEIVFETDFATNYNTTTNAWVTNVDDTVGTGNLPADIIAISGDTTAANNLELMYDGTGYTADETAPASRAQVAAIGSASGGSLQFPSNADNSGGTIDPGSTAFVGVETNDYTDTAAANGTYHIIEDATSAIDVVYGFSVGGARTGVELTWKGYVNNVVGTDNLNVRAWNHSGASWDIIGTLAASASTTDVTQVIPLISAYTGTSGAELGKVYIRFDGTSVSANADINTNQILVAAVNIGQSVGYAQGAIWLDTVNGTAGSEAYVNGTADNPCATWANVKTLVSSVGIKKVVMAAGSSVTLDANTDSYSLIGENWTLALGGQSIDGMYVEGATNVTGIGEATTTQPTFRNCLIGAVTMPPAIIQNCGVGLGDGLFQAAADSGEWLFEDCYSIVSGSGTPDFNFTGTGATSGINNRRWSGGAVYTLDSNCTLSHEALAGGGTTITTGGGDVEVRGTMRALTVTMSSTETVQFAGVTGPISLSGTTTGTVNLYGVASDLTDTTSGATVTNKTVSRENINAEADTALSDYGPATSADILTTQLTESYAADGAAPTVTQALMMIQQMLGDFQIVGTTLTVRKVDGSTTAATFTLNDASDPSALTRAS